MKRQFTFNNHQIYQMRNKIMLKPTNVIYTIFLSTYFMDTLKSKLKETLNCQTINYLLNHNQIKASLILLFTFISITVNAQKVVYRDLTQFVDPFIGTQGGGNTFPGATLPFGMVKLGPDCSPPGSNMGYLPIGYSVKGFSHLHVSGAGGGMKYGNVLVAPVVGDINLDDFNSERTYEKASPGYYGTSLKRYGVDAEFTVSHSVGMHKYKFPESKNANILIDAGFFLSEIPSYFESQFLVGSEIEIVNDTLIEGYTRVRGGWNMGEAYTVYFSAVFNTPAAKYGIWIDKTIYPGKTTSVDNGKKCGAFFRYNTEKGQEIILKVGISFKSIGKARENVKAEIPGWNFDLVRENAKNSWNKVLNTIQLDDASAEEMTIFYTALYHALLQPSDRTNENPKWLSKEPYYDDFYAIWDTFRATHPLITILLPSRQRDIVRAMIDIYKFEGYMPDARSGNFTARTQGGSNSDMIIADAYVKGLTGIDFEMAYKAMLKNAEIPPGGNEQDKGRGGLLEYNNLGYVPFDKSHDEETIYYPPIYRLFERAGTRTLEYAANDYAIATVAKGLGKVDDYNKYKNRAKNWSNLWYQKKSHGAKGFILPRRKDGTWIDDYNLFLSGSWGNFFYESNSWEYSLYVPHDMKALIDSCGGKDAFITRLDTFFINDYYGVSNEPGFLTPCLYNYAGRPDKTNERVRAIIKKHYTATPEGIPGNDDSGSMSSWYIFNAIGFYPNAGQDVYLITSPHFKKTTFNLENGKQFLITAQNLSEKNIYITSAQLNGKPLNQAWFRHADISNGSELNFVMGEKPNDWGTENPPPSMSDN
jgi:predicted alpha-1,2-mannosidase